MRFGTAFWHRKEGRSVTNKEIWDIALRQSAIDCNCKPEDFLKQESLVTLSRPHPAARKYLPLLFFNLICNLFHALFRGVKASGYLIFSTLISSLARTVLSFILMPRSGMEGFYLAWSLSWIIEAVYVFAVFFFGRWNPDKRKLKKAKK